jgi:hypothetical protein
MTNIKASISSPLLIHPKFSKKLAALIAITYSGAFVGIWFSNLVFVLKIILSIWVSVAIFYKINKHLLFKKHQITHSFTLIDHYIVFPNDLTATILSHVYVHSRFVILPLKLSNKKYETLILFDDSLDETTFHYLRIRLLHPLKSDITK